MIKLKIAICFAVFLLPCFAISQNLIVNPSFEEFDHCPTNDEDFYVDNVHGWSNLTSEGSINILTTCANTAPSWFLGYQLPRTGESYLHFGSIRSSYPRQFIFTDIEGDYLWRESAMGTLNEVMLAGTYYFSAYISLVNQKPESFMNSYKTSAIDLALFDTIPSHPFHAQPPYLNDSQVVWMNPISNVITDSTRWLRIGGCFQAKGGERYFAIGTFRDTSQIVLEPNLVYNLNGYSSWTSYLIDDVQIVKCPNCACVETLPDPEPEPKTNLTITNNPSLLGQPVTFQMELGEETPWQLRLYDTAGRLVYKHQEKSTLINHALPESLAKAMYQFVLEVEGMDAIGGKVITGVE